MAGAPACKGAAQPSLQPPSRPVMLNRTFSDSESSGVVAVSAREEAYGRLGVAGLRGTVVICLVVANWLDSLKP